MATTIVPATVRQLDGGWELKPVVYEGRPAILVSCVEMSGGKIREIIQAGIKIFKPEALDIPTRRHWPTAVKEQVRVVLAAHIAATEHATWVAELASRERLLQHAFEADMQRWTHLFGLHGIEIVAQCGGLHVSFLGLELQEDDVPWSDLQADTMDATAFRLGAKAKELYDAL